MKQVYSSCYLCLSSIVRLFLFFFHQLRKESKRNRSSREEKGRRETGMRKRGSNFLEATKQNFEMKRMNWGFKKNPRVEDCLGGVK